MRRSTGAKRVAILAASSLACALITDVVVLGAGVGDPVVCMLSLPFVLGFASLGFVASLYLLWDVNLAKAIPLVWSVTVASAAATTKHFALVSPVIALGVGLLAMQWCRNCSRWVLSQPSPTSVFREGLKGLASRARQDPP